MSEVGKNTTITPINTNEYSYKFLYYTLFNFSQLVNYQQYEYDCIIGNLTTGKM